MILLCESQNQLAGNHQCLLVGQTDCLACLDGVDGGVQSRETYHRSQYHIDRTCLYYLVQCLCSGIYLHIGHIAHQRFQFIVSGLVGYHDGGGLELMSLFGQ